MRQQRPIGFMSERTAEFFLVPAAVRALRAPGARVLPFYFQGNREGNRVGVQSGEGIHARVAAVFARRPKVLIPGDETIRVKFNHSLFRAADAGQQIGVPVLAGVPLVSSLFELTGEFQAFWFHLDPAGVQVGEVVLEIPLSERPYERVVAGQSSMIAEERLCEVVQLSSRCRPWADWVGYLRWFRSIIREGLPFFSFTYSPFFLALVQ